jgi:hypothetical protein
MGKYFGWPAHSFWIESTSPACVVHYVAAGTVGPWEWTTDPAEAAIFGSVEVAEKFFKRLGHSGIGIAVRRAWRGKLNGA